MQERFRTISHPAINNTEIQREKPANGHTSESMNHAGQTDLDSLSKQSSSSLCYLERPSITSACLFSTKQWTFGSEEHQWGFERRQAEDVWRYRVNSDCSFRSGKAVEIMHNGERTCRRCVSMQRVKNLLRYVNTTEDRVTSRWMLLLSTGRKSTVRAKYITDLIKAECMIYDCSSHLDHIL